VDQRGSFVKLRLLSTQWKQSTNLQMSKDEILPPTSRQPVAALHLDVLAFVLAQVTWI